MERIFNPRSIVVVGVSEQPDNLARNILANLRTFGYRGDLYAVGRRGGTVCGVDVVDSLEQVPDGLDLAVMLVPARLIPGMVETCGQKGILRVVIESGGFGEFSEEGRRLEEQLLETARRWGIRFVGPNCISVVNLEAGVFLPFIPTSCVAVRLGHVSVVAQSGGVSLTYLDRLSACGVGVNKGISIGNKTDLDEADYLAYLLDDPGTEMVCLYLESVDDGRRLMDLARSSTKPIIAHKAGRGQASRGIALSHTAALANDDRTVSAAFRQVGILRAEGFRDAVAIAQGLVLPPVRGDDLVVISRSGGHAVIAADAAERHGFRLPPLPDDFARQARELFSADVIALTNPIDLGTVFDFDLYARIVEESLQRLTPDALLLINIYSSVEAERARWLVRRVEEIVRQSGLPVAYCPFAPGEDMRAVQREAGLPIFAGVEEAVQGLAASRDWHRWQARRSEAEPHAVGAPPAEVEELLGEAGVLTTDRALALCRTCGIPVARWEVAATPGEAAEVADRLGYPVVLKVLAPQVTHKSDVGGVALGLGNAATVRREAAEMLRRVAELVPEARSAPLMVQRMVAGGVEVILGGRRDPSFGPVVMFGLGGIHVELLGDVALRVAPLARADVEEMVDEVRGSRLLEGVRGAPPADREALIEALLAVSRLLTENPRIVELDVNPLLVLEQGTVAVDARIVIE